MTEALPRNCDRTPSTDVQEMLSDLAAIWVERWLKYGGGLILDPNCDRLQISMRDDWRRKPPGKARWQRDDARWHDGWHVGRWRELNELAALVPGLRGAIIEHVAQVGQATADGSRVMYAKAV